MNSDAQFSEINDPCYFCGNDKTIIFKEHYYFCPNCSAIYTFNAILESNCKHIDPQKEIPCVSRMPMLIINEWRKSTLARKSPALGKVYIVEYDGKQVCAVCGALCMADGW